MLTRTERLMEKLYSEREEKVNEEYNDMLYKFNPQSIIPGATRNKNGYIPKSLVGIELTIPKREQNDKIIEKAKLLIEENELSLTDIAYKLNFANLQNFSVRFKYYTGLSPSTYRTKVLLDKK